MRFTHEHDVLPFWTVGISDN